MKRFSSTCVEKERMKKERPNSRSERRGGEGFGGAGRGERRGQRERESVCVYGEVCTLCVCV